jgi:hypothetical protein
MPDMTAKPTTAAVTLILFISLPRSVGRRSAGIERVDFTDHRRCT